MTILPILLFIIGLLCIIKGGDWFIDSASWIARVTGMPEVLIGATIVSLGTTLPELMVSVTSTMDGYTEMAVGNAIGSIICNTGLILGICNLLSPSRINTRIYNLKAIIMIFYTTILFIMAQDGIIGRIDSSLLIIFLLIYILINYLEVTMKKVPKIKRNHFIIVNKKEVLENIIKFAGGSIFIYFGASFLVDNGIIIASMLKIPQMIISLTAIALGTSLPELVTSVSALFKGHRNLSLGNILGANILNISMVLGISSVVTPLKINAMTLHLHIPFALLMMLTLIIPTIFSWRIRRGHAFVLLALYCFYIGMLGFIFVVN